MESVDGGREAHVLFTERQSPGLQPKDSDGGWLRTNKQIVKLSDHGTPGSQAYSFLRRLLKAVLPTILHCPSIFFSKAESCGQIQSLPIWLALLGSLFREYQVSAFWGWDYRHVVIPSHHLQGFWGPELCS